MMENSPTRNPYTSPGTSGKGQSSTLVRAYQQMVTAAPNSIPASTAQVLSTGVNAAVRVPPISGAMNTTSETSPPVGGSGMAQVATARAAAVRAAAAMSRRRSGGGSPSMVVSPLRSSARQATVWAARTRVNAASPDGFASGTL